MDCLTFILIFCSVISVCDSARLCTTEDCNGLPYGKTERKECSVEDVPEDGKIISLEMVQQRDGSRCKFNENYGFYTRAIWISRNCEADFRVCYVTDVEDDITTIAPNRSTSTTSERRPAKTPRDPVIFTTVQIERDRSGLSDRRTKSVSTTTAEGIEQNKNRHVAGITPSVLGAIVGALLLVMLIVVIVVVVVKRCRHRKRDSEENRAYTSTGHHPSITSTVSQLTTLSSDDTYDSLDIYREHHPYKVCENPQPHTYTTIYDTIDEMTKRDENNRTDGTTDQMSKKDEIKAVIKPGFIGEYIDLPLKRKSNGNSSDGNPEYNILDSSETGFYKGVESSEPKKNELPPKAPSERYVDLSLNNCVTEIEDSRQYNVLNSSETGFCKGMALSEHANNVDAGHGCAEHGLGEELSKSTN